MIECAGLMIPMPSKKLLSQVYEYLQSSLESEKKQTVFGRRLQRAVPDLASHSWDVFGTLIARCIQLQARALDGQMGTRESLDESGYKVLWHVLGVCEKERLQHHEEHLELSRHENQLLASKILESENVIREEASRTHEASAMVIQLKEELHQMELQVLKAVEAKDQLQGLHAQQVAEWEQKHQAQLHCREAVLL